MTLRIGLYVPTWSATDGSTLRWPEMRALAVDSERLGVDTLWVADEPGFWECWTVLTGIAVATERIEIGPLIACTRYRLPTLFATMVRALDEVSAGRLVLGLGSGFGAADKRWTAFGWDPADHVSRFAEAVEVISRLLREGPITYEGRFYRAAAPNIGPSGPRPTGPPIWVAAKRPRTMAVAARWADAVNAVDALVDRTSVATVRTSVETACVAVGRDPSTLHLTGWVRIAPSPDGRLGADRADTISGSPSAIADRLLEIHDAGVEHITCFVGDEDDEREFPSLTRRSLDRVAPILEAVQQTRDGPR